MILEEGKINVKNLFRDDFDRLVSLNDLRF